MPSPRVTYLSEYPALMNVVTLLGALDHPHPSRSIGCLCSGPCPAGFKLPLNLRSLPHSLPMPWALVTLGPHLQISCSNGFRSSWSLPSPWLSHTTQHPYAGFPPTAFTLCGSLPPRVPTSRVPAPLGVLTLLNDHPMAPLPHGCMCPQSLPHWASIPKVSSLLAACPPTCASWGPHPQPPQRHL